MDEDYEEIEETLKKFKGAHKLLMYCSPIFIGATQIVFMTLNNQANILKDVIVQPSSVTKLLVIEQIASFASLLFAITADSYAARYNLMKFTVIFTSVPVILMSLSDSAFESIIPHSLRSMSFLSGVATMSVYFVLMPVEKAFTAELVPPSSPLLRKYFFVIHFMSYVWQGIFGILISLPNYVSNIEQVTFTAYGLQIFLWISMMIGYGIVLYLRKVEPRNVNFGIGTNTTICLYRVLWVNVINLVEWFRDHNYELKDGFDTCAEIFTSEVLISTKKIFKLFVIHFCLMFFHGLEMILRTMWYQQDASMYRASIWYGFPLDVLLLLCLSVFFPVVEFFVLPLIKKFAHIQLSDLKLVGISTVLLGLAFVLTMSITMLIKQETANNPGPDRVTARMYNAQMYPIELLIKSNNTEPVLLHIPQMKSRVYINDVEGMYSLTIKSPYYTQQKDLDMKVGEVFNMVVSHRKIAALESLDRELYNVPLIGKPDSHIFIIPQVSVYSKVKLKTVEMMFSGLKHKKSVAQLQNDNITHIVLDRDEYLLTITCNTNTIRRKIVLHDFSLHTVLLYNTLKGKVNIRLERLRSGSSLSRLLAFPQVILTGLAIAIGKVSVHVYTYRHAPSNMLATAFSFHRFAFACSIITFNLVTTQQSLSTLGVIGFLVFVFILTFYFVTLQKDLNFDEEDEIHKQKVAEKKETRTEEE